MFVTSFTNCPGYRPSSELLVFCKVAQRLSVHSANDCRLSQVYPHLHRQLTDSAFSQLQVGGLRLP